MVSQAITVKVSHQNCDWFKWIICQKETTEKPQCPVNWKRHDSGAGCLTFEQDLILFSEAEELSLAVDWKCSDMGNIIVSTVCKSFAMWHSSCRVAFNRMPRN